MRLPSLDLNDVRVFARVVGLRSFSAAGRELGMQKSGVSRRVSQLEERLAARLLQRTTRKLSLTDEGRVFYEHCVRILAELEEAEAALGGMRAAPRGLLRVTAPLAFGFLGAPIAAFLQLHPDLQIELVCTDRVVDLVEERFDLAVRVGRLADSSLIARRLGELPRAMLASPGYLKKHGTPRTPADLADHSCLVFGSRLKTVWRLLSERGPAEVQLRGRFAVNDLDLLREATVAGLGIALLPKLGCAEAVQRGRLIRVLPGWSSEDNPLHVVYPSTRNLSSKVKAFVEFLQGRLEGAETSPGARS